MQTLSPSQASAEVPINENFQTLIHQEVYGKKQSTTSGLTWGYWGGRWAGFLIADGTLALTASATNYIVVLRSTGVISVSTAATNWNDTNNYQRVYKLTTNATAVTATEDHRAGQGGVHGGQGIAASDELVNAQTGTAYTYVTGDKGKLVTHSNAAAIAGTLPQAGASFPAGWWMDVQNTGAGTLTITPTTSTVDGAASLALTIGQGVRLVSSGANYFTQRGIGTNTASGITNTPAGGITEATVQGALNGLETRKAKLNGDGAQNFNVASINGGQLAGVRNKILNSNFEVNQRAVSGTVVLAAGAYGHDRWKAGAGGCTYTFSTTNNITTVSISAGTLLQIIEGINLYSGAMKLSWAGTAQGRVDAGGYGASGVAGTAVGGTNQTIEFNAGTLSQVQYEPGTIVTSFEHPIPLNLVIAACQRYCKVHQVTLVATAIASGFERQTAFIPLNMRAIPSSTFKGDGARAALRAGSAGVYQSATASPLGIGVTIESSAPGAGATYSLVNETVILDAEL